MTKKFPYLAVIGSHRDLGYAVGETFREKIRKVIAWRKANIPEYRELLKKTQHYFLVALHVFPKLIEELTSIAIAADVGVMDLFFLNTRSLYDPHPDPEAEKLVSHDRCTTVVSFSETGAIMGHNEDWAAENIDDLYVLKATIGKTKFLGLNYVNELPGTAAAMNNWGLVQGINELHQVDLLGIPQNFLARRVLECQTLDEAEKILTESKQDSGFNHVLVRGKELRNAEIAGGKIDILEVYNQPFVHTNHFLGHLKKYEIYHTQNSLNRYERAKKLVKNNMTIEEMKKLLADHQDKNYPICRDRETISSLILVPEKGEVQICYGPACRGEFVKYTL